MVQAGSAGLDTPRTNFGDATYLSNQQLDFDISQEQSFQSPSKDNNIVQQLQNGRRGALNIRTPRSRVAFGDKRNLPMGMGGEFTPLLKSATRNSALRGGKENIPATPAFLRPGSLDNIPEDFSPLPAMGNSTYGHDSQSGSYLAGTPLPQIDSSSAASTPMVLLPRRNEGPGVLQDGNQLSLREQENVIDKIEKENFGLKLKIHFLEQALMKAGPGFSEAALKENTELKVDKVTMQRELLRYRKTLTSAERDVEVYRQQLLEMQEKIQRKHADQGQQEELDRLRIDLEEKEAELDQLKQQQNQFDDLEDKLQDLEAELREKNRLLEDHEDEIENLKDEAEKQAGTIADHEEALKVAKRRELELEQNLPSSEELADAKETIEDLERDLERLKNEVEEAREDRQEAFTERDRAQSDLEELQDEMANKSISTKGLSRQIEEKASRLQDEVEELREKHSALEGQEAEKSHEIKKLEHRLGELKRDSEGREQKVNDKLEIVQSKANALIRERDSLATKIENLQSELTEKGDERDLLQVRHDALTSESASLQRELEKSCRTIEDLEHKLDHEKTLALAGEREVRDEYKAEIDRLKDDIEDLAAEVRQKERLYDDDSEKWDSEKRALESQRDLAHEKASGLQRTIDKLQEAEGTLSGKEMKLQEAIQNEKERHETQEAVLTRQIKELNEDMNTRRTALEEVRTELSNVREELRLSHREQKSFLEKIQGLEDEVDILQSGIEEENNHASQEISAAKQESGNLRKELEVLKRDVAKAESAAAEAQAEVAAFSGNLQAGESSKEQLASRLRDVEMQLVRSRQEKQTLQDQLAVVKIELHSLRSSRADLEAERDEFQSQLRAMKQQEEETFRLDQERIDLRTAKMKLDGEVRRLREENKAALAQQDVVERALQQEIDRASAEETRLQSEIHDLQKILRGSSEKRELSTAKKTIQHLEDRIHDLENQIASADAQADATNELSIIRRDLSTARQKETEYLQREAVQKDVLRGLKREITELERKAHDAEISRIAISSPHSSTSGSARKSEVLEVRHQLATAHQTLKDLRSQLKEVEKESARKVKAANLEIQSQAEAWEVEKDQLEQSLDEALLKRDELQAKNHTSEATITRLRSKIDRLEKALQDERQNSGEDRTMALERRDLHEMLREVQSQAESLELVVKDRERTIVSITEAESELRAQLKRVRDERALHRSKASSAHEDLEILERKFRKARDTWEAEKKALSRGVRFPNTSLSFNEHSDILAMKSKIEEQDKKHVKELRGLMMQIEWLRARCKREEGFRCAASYAKRYMGLQIELFEACNKADLALIQSTGIDFPERPKVEKKRTLRQVAIMIRATVRMKKGAEQWGKSKKIHERLMTSAEAMRRKARKSSGAAY